MSDLPPTPSDAASSVDERPKKLSPEVLEQRLLLRSPELVEEIFSIAQKEVEIEESRANSLDAKAGTLLGQTGIAVTVALAVGGMLLQYTQLKASLGCWGPWLLGGYSVAIAAGMAAGLLASWAFHIREHNVRVGESVVFDEKNLVSAESYVNKDWKGLTGDSEKIAEGRQQGLSHYRRWLTIHWWRIRNDYFESNERKAKWISSGQFAFSFFLLIITISGLLTVARLWMALPVTVDSGGTLGQPLLTVPVSPTPDEWPSPSTENSQAKHRSPPTNDDAGQVQP